MAKGNTSKGTSNGKGKPPRRKGMIVGSSVGGGVIVVAAVLVLVFAHSSSRDPVTFNYASLPMLGNPHAPVKIVEFGDFKCSACKYFHAHVFPQLKQNYIDTGVVRFYFMNFPFIGPDSTTAAIAGEAIFHQKSSAFWNYYNAMYVNQGSEKVDWATPSFIVKLAMSDVPGINYGRLHQEIVDKKYKSQVEQQYARGLQLGVNSTPTLFINGHEFLNFSNFAALKAAIAKYK